MSIIAGVIGAVVLFGLGRVLWDEWGSRIVDYLCRRSIRRRGP